MRINRKARDFIVRLDEGKIAGGFSVELVGGKKDETENQSLCLPLRGKKTLE